MIVRRETDLKNEYWNHEKMVARPVPNPRFLRHGEGGISKVAFSIRILLILGVWNSADIL